jgi:hypothetical protein
MNYSYPPLLYQRGDDSEEDEGEEEEEEEEYDSNSNVLDDNDPFQIQNIIGQELEDIDYNNADLR